MTKYIIVMIRRHLGLKKNECFQFTNQKSPHDYYYFTNTMLMKKCFTGRDGFFIRPANVKLNYILSKECKIHKIGVKKEK